MRIKVDEDLPRAIASLLVRRGHEVETVQEENLGGAKDPQLWQVTQRERRLLITADKGFADIRRHPPGSHEGVVLLRPREDGIQPLVELMEALLATYRIEDAAGCVTVVTPRGIRIRRP